MKPTLVQAARRRVWVPPIESAADVRRWACIRMAVLGTHSANLRSRSSLGNARAVVVCARAGACVVSLGDSLFPGNACAPPAWWSRSCQAGSPTEAYNNAANASSNRHRAHTHAAPYAHEPAFRVSPKRRCPRVAAQYRKARLRSHAGVCAGGVHARCGARELFMRVGPAA